MKKVLIATALVLSFSACHKWDGKTLYYSSVDELVHIDPNCGNIVRYADGRVFPIERASLAYADALNLCPICVDEETKQEILAAKRSRMKIIKSENDSSAWWSETTYVGDEN